MDQNTLFEDRAIGGKKVLRPGTKRDGSFYRFYDQLNEHQRKAVDTISGPVMVLAGPGTGKTQLLSVRVANILRQTDLYPSNILVLTYTNAGVKAMRERLAKIIGPDGYDVVVETFHSFANWIITESEEAVALLGDRVEMTELERVQLMEHLLDTMKGVKAIRPPAAPYFYRRDIEGNISALRRDGVTPDRLDIFLKSFEPDGKVFEQKHLDRLIAFSTVYRAYENAKSPSCTPGFFDTRGRYDFDDMILFATASLRNNKELLLRHREQFQYVMVDEFQDTNGSQIELLSEVVGGESPHLCLVGDDDQSIYRFQGASAGNFHLMEQLFPMMSKIKLDKNYRSKSQILDVSAQLIRQIPNDERVEDKVLSAEVGVGDAKTVTSFAFGTEQEELTFLVSEIQKYHDTELKNVAVLVRTRRHAQLIIDAFLQAGIPYATDSKEDIRGEHRIQQLLKVIRLAENTLDFEKKDLLLFEVLLSDFFEIPHEDLMKFVVYVNKKKNDYKKSSRRSSTKKTQDFKREETQQSMAFNESPRPKGTGYNLNSFSNDPEGRRVNPLLINAIRVSDCEDRFLVDDIMRPSLFSELLLRFPSPKRNKVEQDIAPKEEESVPLSFCKEIDFQNPNALHRAAWTIRRLLNHATGFPVHALVLKFIRDSDLVDFILQIYDQNEVLRLRDLRAVSSFVENLNKATKAKPDILLADYLEDLLQLEKHDISFRGEMVSSTQDGVRILTAHSSKGLEFDSVFLPFCIQDKAWPKRALPKLIPLPSSLLVGQEKAGSKEDVKKLHEYDENRLFYVAATRAKRKLIFTAAPLDKQVVSRFLSEAGMAPEGFTTIPEEQTLLQTLRRGAMPDPVTSSKEVIRGIIDSMTLSPSGMNTYLGCGRKFLYHHLLLAPQPKQQALVYGICVHNALEKCYRRYKNEGIMPSVEYFDAQFKQLLEWEGVEQSIRQGCEHKFEDAKKWYEQERLHDPVIPVELEKRLTKKFKDGLVFNGQFDKVEDGVTGLTVVDYKTGEPDKHIRALENCTDLASDECDDYLRQLVAYKMLYDSRYRSRKVSSGQLVFLDPVKTTVKKYDLEKGAFVKRTIRLTSEMVKEYEKLLGDTWANIRDLQFERLEEYDEKKCDYCEYKGVCWN
jgi:superfamily I DNA/RNA helicase/CRISPR/Cas system-associated exonuclease Cas4 (RecB family)